MILVSHDTQLCAEQKQILSTPTEKVQDIAMRPILLVDGGYPPLWLITQFKFLVNLSQS